ncbi:hypothetical protein [Variovorax sp. UC122_21]|uniref:hypothetical protein n=1 Tax=Variovorax sp. UC122_21 TaxID=3374554 RepID=UPI00375791A3
MSAVAMRWVLAQPEVAAVIVGVRRGDHLPRPSAHARLGARCGRPRGARRRARAAPPDSGDVYEVERDIEGRHGRVMKYDLNDKPH